MTEHSDIPDLDVDFSKGSDLEDRLLERLLAISAEQDDAASKPLADVIELDANDLSMLAAAGEESFLGTPLESASDADADPLRKNKKDEQRP